MQYYEYKTRLASLHAIIQYRKELLTSNGLTDTIEKTLVGLLQKPAEQNTVGFITTASIGEEFDPTWNGPEWLEDYRQQLKHAGITQIEDVDLKGKTQEELEKTLLSKDIIFVNGGNTFYLMQYVNQSGFGNIVKKFLGKGGVYVGVSAGSIIAGPTIETAGWEPADKNNVNLTDLTALNLVPFFIHPHFEEAQLDMVKNEAQKIHHPLVALTNQQAVLIENGKTTVIGEGEKHFFNGFKEIL
jgi:dipeptidase E